jgi:hypothetical protein
VGIASGSTSKHTNHMLFVCFDASPGRATPKGHNLHHLHSTASRRTSSPDR